jgi:hypothetical protein
MNKTPQTPHRVLDFCHADRRFIVSLEADTYGHIVAHGRRYHTIKHRFTLPHRQWQILGFSHHHWCRSITRTLQEIEAEPSRAVGCIVWDIDHGTARMWGGQYHGRLPRVQCATVTTLERSLS